MNSLSAMNWCGAEQAPKEKSKNEAKLNLWTGIYWAKIQRAMYCDRACVIEVKFVCTEGAVEELARHESVSIVSSIRR